VKALMDIPRNSDNIPFLGHDDRGRGRQRRDESDQVSVEHVGRVVNLDCSLNVYNLHRLNKVALKRPIVPRSWQALSQGYRWLQSRAMRLKRPKRAIDAEGCL